MFCWCVFGWNGNRLHLLLNCSGFLFCYESVKSFDLSFRNITFSGMYTECALDLAHNRGVFMLHSWHLVSSYDVISCIGMVNVYSGEEQHGHINQSMFFFFFYFYTLTTCLRIVFIVSFPSEWCSTIISWSSGHFVKLCFFLKSESIHFWEFHATHSASE